MESLSGKLGLLDAAGLLLISLPFCSGTLEITAVFCLWELEWSQEKPAIWFGL